MDFFSVKTVTARGLRDMYLMVFICLESREVIASTSTEHPNSAWVVEQTKEFLDQTTAPKSVRKLSRDEIEVRSYLGGLVQSFERKAA